MHTKTPLPFGAAQHPLVQSWSLEQSGKQIWLIASEMQYEPAQQSVPSPHGRVPTGKQLPPQYTGFEHTSGPEPLGAQQLETQSPSTPQFAAHDAVVSLGSS